MRDRLIESIRRGMSKHEATLENYVIPTSDYLADYLLADGWTRPPCKKGDVVFVILHSPISRKYYIAEVKVATIIGINGHWYVDCFKGKDRMLEFGVKAFTTRKEAEKVLKDGEG